MHLVSQILVLKHFKRAVVIKSPLSILKEQSAKSFPSGACFRSNPLASLLDLAGSNAGP